MNFLIQTTSFTKDHLNCNPKKTLNKTNYKFHQDHTNTSRTFKYSSIFYNVSIRRAFNGNDFSRNVFKRIICQIFFQEIL